MAYDYVRRTYSVDPVIGQRVTHTVTNKSGIIAREDKSQGHYVQVRFDGQRHSLPCHPTELDYAAAGAVSAPPTPESGK
jgi:hypothetical protein